MFKAEGTPAESDDDASLEELVRSDPPVPFFKCVRPVVGYLWNRWNGKVRPHVRPLALLAACGGMGAAFLALPPRGRGREALRGILLATGTLLPILGGAACAAREVRKFQRSGYPAHVEAQDLLLERIRSGRAERRAGAYDAYLPPPSGSGGGGGTAARVPVVGMVFFPGARVAHAAYAPMAAALSDRGILVVVISLEPLRFESDMDVNRRKARGAIRDVLSGREWLAADEWVLAGHSAGAMTALCLAIENGGERVIHPRISKLVLCGVGMNEMGRPGGTLRAASDGPFRALVLNGTEDGILKFVTPQQRENFTNQLPPSEKDERDDSVGMTKYVSIEGGNHAQFGHYGPQRMDGAASISREEQQRIFVETTAEFLLKGND